MGTCNVGRGLESTLRTLNLAGPSVRRTRTLRATTIPADTLTVTPATHNENDHHVCNEQMNDVAWRLLSWLMGALCRATLAAIMLTNAPAQRKVTYSCLAADTNTEHISSRGM